VLPLVIATTLVEGGLYTKEAVIHAKIRYLY